MQLQPQKTLVRFVIVGLLALVPGLAQTITTTAGNGSPGFAGDNSAATSAQIDTAYGVAVDGYGNTYVADSRNHRVRKIANGIITTVAGTGLDGFSGDGAAATAAQLSSPRAVAVDTQGNLYIADTGNCRIRKVVTLSGVISTVAGTGTPGFSGDGGLATGAQLSYPEGLATDSASNVYVADSWNYRVRKMTADGKIQTIAGNGSYGPFGDGGQATAASLGLINSLTLDAFNNLYLSDSYNHLVRSVTPGGVISTVVGGGFGPAVDGGAAQTASLKFPKGVVTDLQGNLYVADSLNHRIRKVIPGGAISTVAGSGTPGYAGDGGSPASAKLNSPYGVAADPGGDLTFSDLWNYRVRVLDFAASTCSSSISTIDLGVAASGGNIGLRISADAGCPWSIANLPAWLSVSGSTSGTGSAAVTLVAGANSGVARSAALSVGGVSVPIRQLDTAACGGSSSCVLRALPHIAFGGQWTTGLSAFSSGTATGNFSMSFYGDAGASLALPFTGGVGSASTLANSVSAGGMRNYEAENPSVGDLSGWALVTADESVAAQATFRRRTPAGQFYEAAVPSSGGYSRFVMPFDVTTFAPNGAQLFTAFAVVNLDPSATAHFVCTARDQSGVPIPNAVSIPALGPLGHYTAFNFPLLTGKGTLDCSADTLVSAIGLRSIGGDAISTLPVIPK